MNVRVTALFYNSTLWLSEICCTVQTISCRLIFQKRAKLGHNLQCYMFTWCRLTLFPSFSFPNFWATVWKITYRKGREIFIGSADIIASKQFYLLSANQSANHLKASTSTPFPPGQPKCKCLGGCLRVACGLPVGRMIKFWIDGTWLFAKF